MSGDSGERLHTARQWWAWGVVVAGLVAATLLLFYAFPHSGIGPQQPIFFSHRVHAGIKRINCRFCHPYVERSAHAGLPAMEKCFFCHNYVIPLHPQLQLERKHLLEGKPVKWVRLYFVPDFVKFRHLPHVRWAKIECSRCHGPVAEMDRLPQVNFQMGFCIRCHRARGATVDCWLACHH